MKPYMPLSPIIMPRVCSWLTAKACLLAYFLLFLKAGGELAFLLLPFLKAQSCSTACLLASVLHMWVCLVLTRTLSASTISFTRSLNSYSIVQPQVFLSFVGSPSSVSTSAGLEKMIGKQ